MLKKVGYIILLGLFLLYGILIGRYEIFPYRTLQNLKYWVEDINQLLPNNPSSKLLETALQRVHSTRIYVHGDIGNGGGKAVYNQDVFIVNRHGELFFMDFLNFEDYDVQVNPVPMGLKSLEEIFQIDRDSPGRRFRVMDAYVEKEDEIYSLYVSHQYFNGDCFTSKLSRINLKKEFHKILARNEWETIFETTPCIFSLSENEDINEWTFPGHMSGGRITRYDEDHFLISIGSYGQDGRPGRHSFSMDESNPYGKFILVNLENGEYSIYAKGFKNSQGLFLDNEGVIWSTDHGLRGGDELNIIKRGKNYGWPEESLGIQYHDQPLYGSQNQGRHDVHEEPFYAWARSPVGISDLVKIEGKKFGIWEGDLLVTSLNGRSIYRLRLNTEGTRVMYNEEIPIGYRIRNINILGDGSILLRTDNNFLIHLDDAGPIYEEFDQNRFLKNNDIARNLSEITFHSADPQELNGRTIYEQSCASCHSLDEDSYDLGGPGLGNLADRQVGTLEGFRFSSVMESSEKLWNEDLLFRFLKSPDIVFPGTNMIHIPLSDEEVEKLTDYLLLLEK